MYPYFINLDEDSKPKKSVKPDAHGFDVKETKKRRIQALTDARRRQTGPTGAEPGSSSLEIFFEAAPALGASFGVSRLVARRNDDGPIMTAPSAARCRTTVRPANASADKRRALMVQSRDMRPEKKMIARRFVDCPRIPRGPALLTPRLRRRARQQHSPSSRDNCC